MDHDSKDRHMRPTRQLFLILAAATLLTVLGGCGNSTGNDQLVTVDTLLAHSKAEEALQMLQAINTTSLNHHDKAYHALLSTQAAHACRLPTKKARILRAFFIARGCFAHIKLFCAYWL